MASHSQARINSPIGEFLWDTFAMNTLHGSLSGSLLKTVMVEEQTGIQGLPLWSAEASTSSVAGGEQWLPSCSLDVFKVAVICTKETKTPAQAGQVALLGERRSFRRQGVTCGLSGWQLPGASSQMGNLAQGLAWRGAQASGDRSQLVSRSSDGKVTGRTTPSSRGKSHS